MQVASIGQARSASADAGYRYAWCLHRDRGDAAHLRSARCSTSREHEIRAESVDRS